MDRILSEFEKIDFFEFFICGFTNKWTRRIFYGSRNFEISLKMGQHTSYLSHIQNVADNSSSFPLKPYFCGFWPKPQKGNITYKCCFCCFCCFSGYHDVVFQKLHQFPYNLPIHDFFIRGLEKKLFHFEVQNVYC